MALAHCILGKFLGVSDDTVCNAAIYDTVCNAAIYDTVCNAA